MQLLLQFQSRASLYGIVQKKNLNLYANIWVQADQEHTIPLLLKTCMSLNVKFTLHSLFIN